MKLSSWTSIIISTVGFTTVNALRSGLPGIILSTSNKDESQNTISFVPLSDASSFASSSDGFISLVKDKVDDFCSVTSNFILIENPGLNTGDISLSKNVPNFSKLLKDAGNDNVAIISNVAQSKEDSLSIEEFATYIKENCGGEIITADTKRIFEIENNSNEKNIIVIRFDELTTVTNNRLNQLEAHDNIIEAALDTVGKDNLFVVYFSTFYEEPTLGKDTRTWSPSSKILRSNSTKPVIPGNDNLFTKYQFFTPGIFMGTFVSLFLVSVLIVALSWISDLQISYKSFEKKPDIYTKQ